VAQLLLLGVWCRGYADKIGYRSALIKKDITWS